MIVVDCETSGVDPYKNSIVGIGAVDFAHPEETFSIECRVWDGAHIDPASLAFLEMTEESMKDSSKPTEEEAVRAFFEWYKNREEHTVMAQNPIFDISFLREAARRYHIDFSVPYRSVDQHTVAYIHMKNKGIEPPMANKRSDLDSDTIMKYVGIPAEPRPHKAINGALWEAEAFSRLINNKNLLNQFEKYKIPW